MKLECPDCGHGGPFRAKAEVDVGVFVKHSKLRVLAKADLDTLNVFNNDLAVCPVCACLDVLKHFVKE